MIDPSTEEAFTRMHSAIKAVAAARAAFVSFSRMAPPERLELLRNILAEAGSGARIWLRFSAERATLRFALEFQPIGISMIGVLRHCQLEEMQRATKCIREPIGVFGLRQTIDGLEMLLPQYGINSDLVSTAPKLVLASPNAVHHISHQSKQNCWS